MSKGTGSSPFSAGAVVAKKYRLIRLLGEGAMGVVWLAVNESTGGEVALKLIVRPEPELRIRLLREAKACSSIRHKNVVQVYDVGETDGGDPFLVMELLSGETLGDMLARKRRLGQQEAAMIARDVARALAAAHDKSIVHRDLKPANIFLHREPGEDVAVVKVLDFGVSKNLLASDGMRTAIGGAVGSPMYMSPEQAVADASIDGRSDIWSLGIVLFEMLTGFKPFVGDALEVVQKVLMAEIPRVSQKVRKVDAGLDALVAACLQRQREQRPWPASEVAKQLEPFALPGGRAPLASIPDTWSSGDAGMSSDGRSPSSSGTAPLIPAMLARPITAPPDRRSSPGHSSPGYGPTGLEPSKSPGFGPTGLEPSKSPGFGPTALKPASSGHGNTALQPAGAARGRAPATSVPSEEDAPTHRIEPRKAAELIRNAPAPRGPRDGTIPIYTSGPQAAAPVIQVPAPAPAADSSSVDVTLPLGLGASAPPPPAQYSLRGTLKLDPLDIPLVSPGGNSTQPRFEADTSARAADSSTSGMATQPTPSARAQTSTSSSTKKKYVGIAAAALLLVALSCFVIYWTLFANEGTPASDGTPIPTPAVPTVLPTAQVVPFASAPLATATATSPDPATSATTSPMSSSSPSGTPAESGKAGTSPTSVKTGGPLKGQLKKPCDCSSKFRQPACCNPYNPDGL